MPGEDIAVKFIIANAGPTDVFVEESDLLAIVDSVEWVTRDGKPHKWFEPQALRVPLGVRTYHRLAGNHQGDGSETSFQDDCIWAHAATIPVPQELGDATSVTVRVVHRLAMYITDGRGDMVEEINAKYDMTVGP
jgi:hypothetical protein